MSEQIRPRKPRTLELSTRGEASTIPVQRKCARAPRRCTTTPWWLPKPETGAPRAGRQGRSWPWKHKVLVSRSNRRTEKVKGRGKLRQMRKSGKVAAKNNKPSGRANRAKPFRRPSLHRGIWDHELAREGKQSRRHKKAKKEKEK